MKIAVVAPAIEMGGMETTLFRLVGRLLASGAKVTLVTTLRRGVWHGRLQDLGVDVTPLFQPAGRSTMRHAQVVGTFLGASRFDAVIVNHSVAAQAALAMLDDRVAVLPVVHNHDAWVYDVACSNADRWNALVAVGEQLRSGAAERVGARRPVRLIANGVDTPDDLPARPPLDASRPLHVAFVGRLYHHQKGVLHLPAIVSGCVDAGCDVRLTVAGDGPDRDALVREIDRSGLAGRVNLVGPLRPDEALRLMADADALLMPSFYEGLPIALLEAMAHGCVPVASLLAGITSAVVRDGIDGVLVPPRDVRGFSAALARLRSAPDALETMRRAARSRIQSAYSAQSMADGYMTLIDEALGGRLPLPVPRGHGPRIDTSLMRPRDRLPRVAGDLLDTTRRWRRTVAVQSAMTWRRA
ncbi:MAG: glycosyltransferase family 4 protein [Burkholderiales bacterium]